MSMVCICFNSSEIKHYARNNITLNLIGPGVVLRYFVQGPKTYSWCMVIILSFLFNLHQVSVTCYLVIIFSYQYSRLQINK